MFTEKIFKFYFYVYYISIYYVLKGTPTSQTASISGSCPASPAPMSHNHSIEEPVSVAVITTSTPVSTTTTVAIISESISTISTMSTVISTTTSVSIIAAPVRKKKDETTKVCLH